MEKRCILSATIGASAHATSRITCAKLRATNRYIYEWWYRNYDMIFPFSSRRVIGLTHIWLTKQGKKKQHFTIIGYNNNSRQIWVPFEPVFSDSKSKCIVLKLSQRPYFNQNIINFSFNLIIENLLKMLRSRNLEKFHFRNLINVQIQLRSRNNGLVV